MHEQYTKSVVYINLNSLKWNICLENMEQLQKKRGGEICKYATQKTTKCYLLNLRHQSKGKTGDGHEIEDSQYKNVSFPQTDPRSSIQVQRKAQQPCCMLTS